MDPETNHQQNHQFRRLPKGERRVRFADSMGMELVSIFLFDLISNYYFASIHNHKQLPPQASRPITNSSPALRSQSQYPTITTPSLATTPAKPIINNTSRIQNTALTSTPAAASAKVNAKIHHHNGKSSYHQLSSYNNINNNNQQASLHSTSPSTDVKNHNTIQRHQNNSSNINNGNHSSGNDSYVCDFTQPISLISFKERVKLNKVHLETCSVNSVAGNISISCTIRVLNLSYDKSVIVRYTTDEWHTYTDSLSSYKPGSNDGWSDRFTSTFSVTNQVKQFTAGQRIQFAIRYTYGGDNVQWDNNGGLNYKVKKI